MTNPARDPELTPAAPGDLLLIPIEGGAVRRLSRTEPARVGRDASCGVCLDHPQISREHAGLEPHGARWKIIDRGSRNGTYVNEQRIEPHEAITLHNGDRIAFGPCIFTARQHGAESVLRTETDQYATRASIFIRLRHEQKDVRELGWKEFRQRYAPVIVGFARHAGLRAQDAEDVLQEVMLRFFRVVPEFEYDPQRGRFRGYLKRATLNVIRDRARGDSTQPVAPQWCDEQDADADTEWDRIWAEQLFARALDEARLRFDPVTLSAFEFYAQREVPAEEVARRLELSVASVHQAKSRVMRAVREIVARLAEDEG